MNILDEIFAEYVRMRENGLETKEALRALRAYIEALDVQDKEFLAQQLRSWEKKYQDSPQSAQARPESSDAPPKPRAPKQEAPPPSPPQKASSGLIKPLSAPPPRPGNLPENPQELSQVSDETQSTPPLGTGQQEIIWLECPHCGAKNRVTEVFCYACGQLLQENATQFETRHFASATDELYTVDYFGRDSVVILTPRDDATPYEIRPQLRNHEVVIGRSSGTTAMRPDVDLARLDAASLGVSRLHLALRYEETDSNIIVYDLGSANGSFINGQTLHPKEVRVLRHGDELRLGRLVLGVLYHHPGQEL